MTVAQVETLLNRVKEYSQAGMHEQAELVCREIVQQWPTETRAWRWLGSIAYRAGRFETAEEAYRHAARLEPNSYLNWSDLGCALLKLARNGEAESCFRRALAIENANATNWSNLAGALLAQKQPGAAAEAFRQSLVLDNTDAEIWVQLARAQLQNSNLSEAKTAFEKTLALAPAPETALEYGQLLLAFNDLPAACHVLRQVTEQVPGFGAAWQAYGLALSRSGDALGAIAAYRGAMRASHATEEVRYFLAMLLFGAERRTSEARRILKELLSENPQLAKAWIGQGLIDLARGNQAGAIAAMRQALRLEPSPANHSQLLQTLQYCQESTPERLLQEHRQWNALHGESLAGSVVRKASRSSFVPLRLGLVAPHFSRDPVAFLVLPALEHLDRSACHITLYSDDTSNDDYTARFQSASDAWHYTKSLSHDELAARISGDQIDVLIDLVGHNGSRLLTFARKPAPMQMTWLGYVGTTGLSAIDYLVADRYHVSDGEERFYTERILRLPNGYVCYSPPPACPPVSDLPCRRTGRVTFGCFNAPQKFSPTIVEAWAEILQRVPTATLLLKFAWLGEAEEQEEVRSRFRQHGIDASRIQMEGWTQSQEFLENYHHIDLALDTQPYSGGLTTCEALWMGVPVITFPGKTFAGRHATSHLMNAGYPQFVAENISGYIDLAVEWANRLDELTAIRAGMREQVRNSPLCDAPRFATDFLNAIQEAGRSHVAGPLRKSL